jgi:hypothetical protein
MRTRRILRKGTRRRQRGRGKMEDLFPRKTGVDYTKLKITPEGEYSITKRLDGELLIRHMKTLVKHMKHKTITDLTGNVGGDTILFGLHFKKVHSIEINPENYDALKNNVEQFGLTNVDLHLGDSTKVYNWKTDVLYIDAPWGGPDYKEKKELDLFLGDVRIDTFLQDVLKRDTRPEVVFLKLPRNYVFSRLEELPNVESIKKFRIRGYFVVGLLIKMD